MGWKFWRREPNPMDPQELLAQGRQAVPAGQFELTIEDVFTITGRGTVVTGQVATGLVRVGDQVRLSRAGQPVATIRIAGVEMFRKKTAEARAGDHVGLLLDGVERDQVHGGDVLSG
ncbi:EF-Tu/IF-2/RF-3 family GTPase [Actinokineospora sp. HUAS TT18]|uniref:EF-Tu/IF-2/RF-3 family GTPase n=1 Tax=Actinokineospora sp. HUAS TT18 TaxID=3447451 RepID=UPI003F51D441